MDISFNTISYLMNSNYQSKFITKQEEPMLKEQFKKDLKFYKKRIYDITKKLLKHDKINNTVSNAFEEYCKILIEHFKITDTKDIIQQDYKQQKNVSFLLDETNEKIDDNTNTNIANEDFNNLIMKKNNKNITIENSMNIKKNKKINKPQFIPKQKNINLKDNQLKYKGLQKEKYKQ